MSKTPKSVKSKKPDNGSKLYRAVAKAVHEVLAKQDILLTAMNSLREVGKSPLLAAPYGLDPERPSSVAGSQLFIGEHAKPIDMILHCPRCHMQHVDKPHDSWPNPPHRSHLCQSCGTVWRPCDEYTNGVEKIRTTGKSDDWQEIDPQTSEVTSEMIGEPVPTTGFARLNVEVLGEDAYNASRLAKAVRFASTGYVPSDARKAAVIRLLQAVGKAVSDRNGTA